MDVAVGTMAAAGVAVVVATVIESVPDGLVHHLAEGLDLAYHLKGETDRASRSLKQSSCGQDSDPLPLLCCVCVHNR